MMTNACRIGVLAMLVSQAGCGGDQPAADASAAHDGGDGSGGDLGIVDASAAGDGPGVTDAASSNTEDLSPDPGVPGSLLSAGAVRLVGVTSDGWAVYVDVAARSFMAVPIAGGKAQKILPIDNGLNPFLLDFTGMVSGKVAFLYPMGFATPGALWVWTAAGGAKLASASSAPLGVARDDGAAVLFFENYDSLKDTADIVGASVDLAVKRTLVAGGNLSCAKLAFAGARAVTGSCPPMSQTRTMTSWDASWNRVADLVIGVRACSIDRAGTTMLALTDGKDLKAVPVGGGNPTTIAANVTDGYILSDGTAAIYTAGGALLRSPIINPAPTTLVNQGVAGLHMVPTPLSPDDRYVLYYTKTQSIFSDLAVSSTTQAGVRAVLDATPEVLVGSNVQFTADGSHVCYIAGDLLTGILTCQPIGGGAALTFGTSLLTLPTTATRLLSLDNGKTDPMTSELRCDVRIVDAAGGPAKRIVARAGASLALSPARDQVVFAANAGMTPGLYVTSVQ